MIKIKNYDKILIYTSKNDNLQSQKSISKMADSFLGIHDGYHFYEVDLVKKYEETDVKQK